MLKAIHYNPDCFSKIVEDFDDYVEHTRPGRFWKDFDNIKKSTNYTDEDLICSKITTKNMELALAEFKKPWVLFGRFRRGSKITRRRRCGRKNRRVAGRTSLSFVHFLPYHRFAMDGKLAKIYYSPGGYWKGFSAIRKLAEAAKVPEETAKKWLVREALWQIFLPAPDSSAEIRRVCAQ